MAVLQEQLQFVRSPKAVITRLATDSNAMSTGLKHVLLLAVLYELAILLWAVGGATPTLPAFVSIPDDRYYYYQLIFMMPMIVTAWLVAAGVAYVLARLLGGNGSYDAILGGFGIATLFSSYFTLIPDFVQGVLWTRGWVPFSEYQDATSRGPLLAVVWSYMLAYNVSHLILYAATLRFSQNLGTLKSAFVATISFFVSVGLFITIVR